MKCPQCAAAFEKKRGGSWLASMRFVPSFQTKKELRQHMRCLHGDLDCPVCVWAFESRTGRQKHLKATHKLTSKQIAVLVPGGGRMLRAS